MTKNILQNLITWLLSHGLKITVILFAACLSIRLTKTFFSKLINNFIKKSKLATNEKINKERTETLIKIFNSVLKVVIWLIAILTILPEVGINPTPFLAGASLIGLAVGMGSRNLVQDYLAGLFILLEDQYRVGEEIDIAGKKGKVISLTLRRTIIKDEKGVICYIPNGQVKIVSNFSRKEIS